MVSGTYHFFMYSVRFFVDIVGGVWDSCLMMTNTEDRMTDNNTNTGNAKLDKWISDHVGLDTHVSLRYRATTWAECNSFICMGIHKDTETDADIYRAAVKAGHFKSVAFAQKNYMVVRERDFGPQRCCVCGHDGSVK